MSVPQSVGANNHMEAGLVKPGSNLMKVALFTRYPPTPQQPRGGVESVAVVLVRALAAMDDLDVHVVTLEGGLVDTVVETHDGATVHRRLDQLDGFDTLVGSGRLEHLVSTGWLERSL